MNIATMATALRGNGSRIRFWIPLAFGLTIMYAPTYVDLWQTFWQSRDGSNGFVMVAIIAWLVWRERRSLWPLPEGFAPVIGSILVTLGLMSYVLGRSQFFYQLEVLSQIPVLLGLVFMYLGRDGLRRLWFPILMLVFVVPIPGSILDQILLPLKDWVSGIVDLVLHHAGYPIARSGVVLLIGPYTLMIADACSGLNSMVALSGIGLVYVYLAREGGRWPRITLLLCILPIAFVANILRVLSLVLITYYRGEEAGVSFHDRAGLLEIIFAFSCFFALDRLLHCMGRTARRVRAIADGQAIP